MTESKFLDAYEQLALAAAKAEKEQNSTYTSDVAKALGMVEEPADRQMDNYVLRQDGWELVYSWRYYDTSQAFSPGLDKNILSVTLRNSGSVVKSSHHQWMD